MAEVTPTPTWVNRLPAWIESDDVFRGLPGTYQNTLRVMANAGTPSIEGHLVDIWGGMRLARRIGCSRRTLARHLNRLEAGGFIVATSIGNSIEGVASTYAIPGARGGLDERAERRPRFARIRAPGQLDAAGRPRFTLCRLRPQSQLTLWAPPEVAPAPSGGGGGAVSIPVGKSGGVYDTRDIGVYDTGGIAPMSRVSHPSSPSIPIPAPECFPQPPSPEFARAVAWLDSVGWGNTMAPAKRRRLLARDPAYVVSCVEAYRAEAQAIRERGGRVRRPAALFSRIFFRGPRLV